VSTENTEQATPVNVKGILSEWLKAHGYDGLAGKYDCGCPLNDLMPCDEPQPDCVPAYRVWVQSEGEYLMLADPSEADQWGTEEDRG
jgi:hypothetical protein